MIELTRCTLLGGTVAAAAGSALEKAGAGYRLIPVTWAPAL